MITIMGRYLPTVGKMHSRYGMGARQDDQCGQCRYFDRKPEDTFEHAGFSARHYRCMLFNHAVRKLDGADFGDGSTDWSPDWLACGAFWAHEGEVPA